MEKWVTFCNFSSIEEKQGRFFQRKKKTKNEKETHPYTQTKERKLGRLYEEINETYSLRNNVADDDVEFGVGKHLAFERG